MGFRGPKALKDRHQTRCASRPEGFRNKLGCQTQRRLVCKQQAGRDGQRTQSLVLVSPRVDIPFQGACQGGLGLAWVPVRARSGC